jgi:predicted metal-dependent phosphoesterase TrpH
MNEAELRAFLPQAVAVGLDGMETLYPRYSPEETALAETIATEFGLLPSGGSDFHGDNKPDIALGTGTGELRVPCHFLDKLKARKA